MSPKLPDLPTFIAVQPLPGLLPNGNSLAWALRYKNIGTPQMALEYQKHEVEMFDYTGQDMLALSAEVLLQHGTKYHKITSTNVITHAAVDIARTSYRSAGNHLIVHPKDAEKFREFIEPIMHHHDFYIHEVDLASLRGNVIMTFNSTRNLIDSGMIMVYSDETDQFGYTVDSLAAYTRIMPFKTVATLPGLEGRRARKNERLKSENN